MTIHVKTNEQGFDLAAGRLAWLDRIRAETEADIEKLHKILARPGGKPEGKEHKEKRVVALKDAIRDIDLDIADLEYAQRGLSNPSRTWWDVTEIEQEGFAKEQRLVVARICSKSIDSYHVPLKWMSGGF